MKYLAIIPARAGSKRLPKKNKLLFDGKPLAQWTIEAALNCGRIKGVCVSSDDIEILSLAEKMGCITIERPPVLSNDSSKIIDVITHVFESDKIDGQYITNVILLQPTSPNRTTFDIENSISLFESSDCDSLVSVTKYEHSPYWALIKSGTYLKPLFSDDYLLKRSQELPDTYIPNGAIYISNAKRLLCVKSFFSDKTIPYIMPEIRSIDIDNTLDFYLAESIHRNIISSNGQLTKESDGNGPNLY